MFCRHDTNLILMDVIALFSVILAIFITTNLPYSYALGDNPDALDKGDVAEIFDLGSGIFAAILFVLSLIAYRKVKLKKILFVAIAFGLFAVRTILSRLDLFMPDIESSFLELMLAITSFIALSLFFLAIVRKDKVVRKSASM
jgi:hypothetical protein